MTTILESYNIFLDDERTPKKCIKYMPRVYTNFYKTTKFVIVRNYDAFTQLISGKYTKQSFPEIISFDHDLGYEHYMAYMQYHKDPELYKEACTLFKEKTGMDCAKWLVDFCMDNHLMLPKYVCHTKNGIGAANMTGLFESFKKHQLKYGL